MGLFDKLLSGQGPESIKLNEQEAFLGVLLVTIAADGEVADEETQSLVIACQRSELLGEYTPADYNATFKKLADILRKHGVEVFLTKTAEPLSPELKETAFAVAADLIFADGSVEEGEQNLLEAIQKSLGVADDLAVKIVEVMQIKNRA
jgi:tellurite resistance protein